MARDSNRSNFSRFSNKKDTKTSISDSLKLTRRVSRNFAFIDTREESRESDNSNPTVSMTTDGDVVDTKRQNLLTRAKISLSDIPKYSYTDGKQGLSDNMFLWRENGGWGRQYIKTGGGI